MVVKRKSLGRIKGFSFQFIPYSEIQGLNSNERIKRILTLILESNILILQGKLSSEEEARLIGDTMAMIGHVKHFKGIELAVIEGDGKMGFYGKMKYGIANMIAGTSINAITIIGPATIVKEMKKNPKKIELLLKK